MSKTTVMVVTMTIEGDPPLAVSPVTNQTTVQSAVMSIGGIDLTLNAKPVQ